MKYFLEQCISTPKQQKWIPKLLGYDYEIVKGQIYALKRFAVDVGRTFGFNDRSVDEVWQGSAAELRTAMKLPWSPWAGDYCQDMLWFVPTTLQEVDALRGVQ